MEGVRRAWWMVVTGAAYLCVIRGVFRIMAFFGQTTYQGLFVNNLHVRSDDSFGCNPMHWVLLQISGVADLGKFSEN